MEKTFSTFVMLLTLLMIHEVVILTEARICYSKSKQYRGICYFRSHASNCKSICKREKFISGRRHNRGCFCFKRCGGDPRPHPPHSDGGEGGGDVGSGSGGGEGGGDEGGEAPPSFKH
ncbi:UNVERIFIED_CONTAM: hypothetical protein Sradi_5527300 [Sesamum radiatum]|uniref:Knottins-like domain-containing protein n=1 Tax=Sesamum radiatum TaxID=300843 RepID=A0AAW2LE76_SESRA